MAKGILGKMRSIEDWSVFNYLVIIKNMVSAQKDETGVVTTV